MTLDIEGVLRDHVVHGCSSGGCWNADCLAVDCHWSAHGDTGGFAATMDAHRAHVAAVLREQIAAWLGSEAAEESVYEALDPGGHGWAAGDSPSVRETIRALAAQVAPSRVPGEES